MLSTLRPLRRRLAGQVATTLVPQECLVPRLRGALLARNGPQARLCSDGAGKKPPKGFEKFYRQGGKGKAETSETSHAKDAKDGQKGPSEGTKDAAKEEGASRTSSGKSGPGKKDGKDGGKSGGSSDSNQPLNQLMQHPVALGAGAGALLLYMYSGVKDPQDEITIQEMMREYLIKGYVERVQIVNKSRCRIHLRPDAPTPGNDKTLVIQLGNLEAFEMKLEQLQRDLGLSPLDFVPVQYVTEMDFMSEILLPYLPSLLLLIPMILMARAMSGGMGGGPGGIGGGPGGRNIFSMGKAFPSGNKNVKSKVRFTDVAGLEQAKREVAEFVDFLRHPAKYEKLGARVPKGGLLVGPPGTGKTLLAKAVAGEADVPFYSMSGSDFVEMFVGVGPSRVRDLFKQARETAPSIIFIDEIDAVGRKRGRGGATGGNDERENTLNQMLVEMDGFTPSTGVVVLAGTNRVDVLDNALTRPGRFDRQIAIDKPDLAEREQIYMVHLKPVNVSKSLSVESVAKRMAALTPGFAGSDIANICNEAAIFAARRDAETVEMEDFERATERVIGGLPKQNSIMSPQQKRTVALHETGHAICGWFLEHADPLLKVSIVPRSSGALGFAQYLPEEMSLYSQEAILDKIAVSLAGRAAEELFVGRISTGASDDLDKVTKMAYSMVAVYGMNPKLGLLSYNQNNASEQFYKPYSEETGQAIDREARAIVDFQYERVKTLLTEKKQLMLDMADSLLEKETLVYSDLLGLLGERPWALKAEYKKFVTASGTSDEQEKTEADATAEPAATDAGAGGEEAPKAATAAA